MTFFEKLINATIFTMVRPTFFSSFHLGFLLTFVLATIIVCIWLYKIPNDLSVRGFVAACWGVMLLFEVYKQINFAFAYHPQTNTVVWDYDWHAFPFQFCSSPLCLRTTARCPSRIRFSTHTTKWSRLSSTHVCCIRQRCWADPSF